MSAEADLSTRARARLIVALDVPDRASALALAGRLAGHVGMLKIGLELFVAEGPAIVRELRERHPELEIFLDIKLHDIPNTMAGAIRSARSLGARFITVHAGSGIEHLRRCVDELAFKRVADEARAGAGFERQCADFAGGVAGVGADIADALA